MIDSSSPSASMGDRLRFIAPTTSGNSATTNTKTYSGTPAPPSTHGITFASVWVRNCTASIAIPIAPMSPAIENPVRHTAVISGATWANNDTAAATTNCSETRYAMLLPRPSRPVRSSRSLTATHQRPSRVKLVAATTP